jgi:hypothetical protein
MFAAYTCVVPQASHANPLSNIYQRPYKTVHVRVGQLSSDAVKQPATTAAAASASSGKCVHEAVQGTVAANGDSVKAVEDSVEGDKRAGMS